MNAPSKLPPQGRIREKYRAKPTERERKFHEWLIDSYPCACGCGRRSTVVHHPLQRHPEQRWRRDHEFVVPMDDLTCHRAVHALGSDQFAGKAWAYRAYGYDAGFL